ncbi:ankyrin repeat protein [Metarhizium robertsii]|uniref:Peptidase S8, subtilisin, Ser-active site protein n=2 Tax=Metarhizium robertsii TaxID=568076 RepID=E9FDX5_METRA|nr:Peptidase S8, subtilisin, Ser-active site protein [Metarhizium robertsii ARSEF 23]EFY94070.1 Peptidase S8, subtilisin, Ser-active site protein [Metarhizium robertsii ARSEF 23]EXU94848.1 ankyrin repeat protein [Metarhizium robertsii]
MSTGKKLLLAAKLGRFAEVQSLLDEGVDPNAKDSSGSTPLHIAAKGESPEVVELLLEHGANSNTKEESGRTPLHYAAQNTRDEIAQILLDYWADPKITDKVGSTPLHYAATHGNPEIIRLLLESGANPNAQDESGLTPIHYAAKHGEPDSVGLLLKKGADPKVKDRSGSTPLFYAAAKNVLELLLGRRNISGMETDAKGKQMSLTPMYHISINGNHLDESIKPATDASETNYILVQTRMQLNEPERQYLVNAGLIFHDYVSKNTYLCGYRDEDLDKIRQLDRVVFVDAYRKDFKIASGLKSSKANIDRDVKVNVIFHDGINSSRARSLPSEILELEDVKLDYTNIPYKAQITIPREKLEPLAGIDEVRLIEEVGEIKPRNNQARLIVGLDVEKESDVMTDQKRYEGEGQVIAISDTGLGTGHRESNHYAFEDRILALYAMNGTTLDPIGHGTHVCGSAVGNAAMNNGVHIRGTAPKSQLVMQSLWHSGSERLNAPRDLYQLFNMPYTHPDQKVRVHSNSWNQVMVDGQLPYTSRAEDIDTFVWKHKDMVICWAAGNDATFHHAMGRANEGQIGAEAAAKNCITIGACENRRPDMQITYDDIDKAQFPDSIKYQRVARDPSLVAAFSSRGPTSQDGLYKTRIKPDIVAPGTLIISAHACIRSTTGSGLEKCHLHDEDNRWCYDSGTSMSTPLVAGCAAVLRQVLIPKPEFNQASGCEYPSAALIKAILINGADIVSDPNIPPVTPNVHSGFGRVNMAKSMTIACGKDGTGFKEEELSNDTEKIKQLINLRANHACNTIKATLTWSDFPGDALKNRLRLELRHSSFLNPKSSDHQYNNVQQVLWKNLPPGNIAITVGIIRKLFRSPQPFAVVWHLYSEKGKDSAKTCSWL